MIYYQVWVYDGKDIGRPTNVYCTATDMDTSRYALWKQLDGTEYTLSSPTPRGVQWKWIFVEVEVEDL